jgi:thioredoxin 1
MSHPASKTATGPLHVTGSTFESEVISSPLPVVIDFWAPWCGPCRAIAPVLDKMAQQWAGQVKVVKVNVDEEPEIAGTFNIRSIPTLVAMSGRDVVDIRVGFGGPASIESLFTQAAAAVAASKAAASR